MLFESRKHPLIALLLGCLAATGCGASTGGSGGTTDDAAASDTDGSAGIDTTGLEDLATDVGADAQGTDASTEKDTSGSADTAADAVSPECVLPKVHGSCDRTTSGVHVCDEWYGTSAVSEADQKSECASKSGTYTLSSGCTTADEVGKCLVGAKGNPYMSRYTYGTFDATFVSELATNCGVAGNHWCGP